jgi:hypothetical protein
VPILDSGYRGSTETSILTIEFYGNFNLHYRTGAIARPTMPLHGVSLAIDATRSKRIARRAAEKGGMNGRIDRSRGKRTMKIHALSEADCRPG